MLRQQLGTFSALAQTAQTLPWGALRLLQSMSDQSRKRPAVCEEKVARNGRSYPGRQFSQQNSASTRNAVLDLGWILVRPMGVSSSQGRPSKYSSILRDGMQE